MLMVPVIFPIPGGSAFRSPRRQRCPRARARKTQRRCHSPVERCQANVLSELKSWQHSPSLRGIVKPASSGETWFARASYHVPDCSFSATTRFARASNRASEQCFELNQFLVLRFALARRAVHRKRPFVYLFARSLSSFFDIGRDSNFEYYPRTWASLREISDARSSEYSENWQNRFSTVGQHYPDSLLCLETNDCRSISRPKQPATRLASLRWLSGSESLFASHGNQSQQRQKFDGRLDLRHR